MIAERLWMLRRFGASARSAWRAYRQRRAAWRRFWGSYRQYRSLSTGQTAPLHYLYPCLGDDTRTTEIEPTYFYQDAWAFERIVQQRPAAHVDVGSHHKFVALLSKVVPVTMVDIRPLSLPLDGLSFREGSILALPFADGGVASLSSLCVVEHIGLGRYGDALDPNGTRKAVAELRRVLAPGGDLYISVPLHDTSRTYFNAHRAFAEDDFLALCEPLCVVDRKYIHGSAFGAARQRGFGTGCYHLKKKGTGNRE